MPSILFVCSANRFRSPLAAAIFSYFLTSTKTTGNWNVSSAGSWAEPDLPPVIEALDDAKKWGLDISNHRSRPVSAVILSHNNLILVMEAGQKEALQIEFPQYMEKVHLLSDIGEDTPYDVPDPFTSKSVTHQEIANELFELIKRGFSSICRLAQNQ